MRLKSIDLLRLIAIFYMFFQHMVLSLLIQNENQGAILFLFNLVPICPALFLFVSGFSITILLNKYEKNMLYKKLIKRGFLLIIISFFLFFFENGLQFPDIFFASGILNTIGLMIIISSFIILLPYKIIITTMIILILLSIHIIFEIFNIKLFPFNNAFEPIIPTVTFGFIGLLFGFFHNIFNNKNFKIFIMITGFLSLFFLFFLFSFNEGFSVYSENGTYEIIRFFKNKYMYITNIIENNYTGITEKFIWNYKVNNFFASLSAVFILFVIFYILEDFFKKRLPDFFTLPGQFALINYVFHFLYIIVFIIIFGYNNLTLIQFIIFLFLLFALSYFLSFILKKHKFKKL
ncbi:MAG: DUF1624 domain-containing protein [Spirochaetes bacterium]|nr:DUF1624 domain-containing protein [Spirochaetota bacterium]